MLTYEIIEDTRGTITSIKLSNGLSFNHIKELEKYCRSTEELIYGEELHRLAVVATSVGIKSKVNSALRNGLRARYSIGKTLFVDVTNWKLDIKADARSVEKMLEIESFNEFVGSSPALYVNNSFYSKMGWNEALMRSKWAPSNLDGYLCSSKLPNRSFKPAYSGGMLSSPANPRKVYTDVQSYDITSAYPYSALVTEVPVGSSTDLSNEQLTKISVIDGRVNLKEGFGFIGLFRVNNARRRNWVRVPLLRDSDSDYVENVVMDRLGVVSGNLRVALTPQDLEVLHMQYEYDSIEVKALTIHRLGRIPEKAANFILEAYDKKNNAPKDSMEREKAKVAINTIIGLWGTDPYRSINKSKLGEDGFLYEGLKGSISKAFANYAGTEGAPGHAVKKPRTWDFRWAAYITANTRLRVAKAELACFEAGLEVLYCDTDSIKVSGSSEIADKLFGEFNSWVMEAYDHDGIGLWVNESEGYHRAVFRGIKVYAFENAEGKKTARISGVSKEDITKVNEELPLDSFAKNDLEVFVYRRSPIAVENDPFGAKTSYALQELIFNY